MVPIVTRETTRDVRLGSEKQYLVPKGTRMMILIQGVHHRWVSIGWAWCVGVACLSPFTNIDLSHTPTTTQPPKPNPNSRADIWPEPLAYQPDRFLEPPKPFTFLPFIDGPRNCLGQHLALLESKIVLATLCQRFTFEAAGGEAAGRKHPSMVPVIPADPGLMVRVA